MCLKNENSINDAHFETGFEFRIVNEKKMCLKNENSTNDAHFETGFDKKEKKLFSSEWDRFSAHLSKKKKKNCMCLGGEEK